MKRSWLLYALVLALVGVSTLAVGLGTLLDRQSRQVAALARDYLAAVERQDLAGALDYLAPSQRARVQDFVANQLGNRFEVRAVAVRAPSLLDRWLGGQPDRAISATVDVAVNPGAPDGWKTSTVVPLAWQDGRWYFVEPPLWPA